MCSWKILLVAALLTFSSTARAQAGQQPIQTDQTAPSAQAAPPVKLPVELKARLLAPISTKTSNAGDHFSAVVDGPEEFKGAVLNGRVTKVNAPARGLGKGTPSIAFEFDSITNNGVTKSIGAELNGVSNSKGVKDVDEEGRAIGRTSNKKRVLSTFGGAGFGAALGALKGGAGGAIAGAAVGGAAGLAIGLTMTTAGTDIEFFPGSVMTLNLSALK